MTNLLLETILVIGLVTSAFFAIYLKETLTSVLSLNIMFILLSLFYFSLNAPFVAIFQLALGIGTTAILLLVSDTLTKGNATTSSKKKVLGLIISLLLSIPIIFGTKSTQTFTRSSSLTFSNALWDLRSIDIIAQGIVVLTVALGVAFLLNEERRRS